jgi:Uma2 family endonuclease
LYRVTVLELQTGGYREVGKFQGQDRIMSPAFSNLTLRAEQVLKIEP